MRDKVIAILEKAKEEVLEEILIPFSSSEDFNLDIVNAVTCIGGMLDNTTNDIMDIVKYLDKLSKEG